MDNALLGLVMADQQEDESCIRSTKYSSSLFCLAGVTPPIRRIFYLLTRIFSYSFIKSSGKLYKYSTKNNLIKYLIS